MKDQLQHLRVLAVAPSSMGFGFAIFEGQMLVDWGIKVIEKQKNVRSLRKIKELCNHYRPQVIVLEDTSTQDSRRSARIKTLQKLIVAMAQTQKLKVALFSRRQISKIFFGDAQGTKHALTEILAKRFPEQLGPILPAKRRPWMNEPYWMRVFDAVALVIACKSGHSSL